MGFMPFLLLLFAGLDFWGVRVSWLDFLVVLYEIGLISKAILREEEDEADFCWELGVRYSSIRA